MPNAVTYRLGRLFFADPWVEGAPARMLGWKPYFIVGSIFLLTRGLVLLLFWYQGGHFPFLDSYAYLDLAQYIETNAALPHTTVQSSGARLFPGTSIVACNFIFRNLVVSGFFVSWTGGLLAVLLFHRLYQNLRTSVIHAVFLPSWLATSACILSEGPTLGLCLVLMSATRFSPGSGGRIICLVLSGFAAVSRTTAIFYIFPWLFGIYVADRNRKISQLIKDSAAASLPLICYAAWAYFSGGEVFPQQALQAEEFRKWAEKSPGNYYPREMLTWPGKAFVLGLLDFRQVRPIVKMVNVAHLVLMVIAIVLLVRMMKGGHPSIVPRSERLAITLVFATNLLFCLMIGGWFGHAMFYRYVASHMNPVVVLALFGQGRLRWGWIGLLALVDVVIAGNTGAQG